MAETKHILILANSERGGGRCVAGKVAVPRPDGSFDVRPEWIRLTNPGATRGGAVPYLHTLCRPNRTAVRPLDVVTVSISGHCNNPDHPEDWFYDPTSPWQWIASAAFADLAAIADSPPSLWHQAESDAVPAGYIRTMPPPPASLYLIKAPATWDFKYYKEWNNFKGYDKKRRRLHLTFAGRFHDFAVTDPEFDRRFKLPDAASKWPSTPQALPVPSPADCYFCLSLTPEFNQRHYKICATTFEP